MQTIVYLKCSTKTCNANHDDDDDDDANITIVEIRLAKQLYRMLAVFELDGEIRIESCSYEREWEEINLKHSMKWQRRHNIDGGSIVDPRYNRNRVPVDRSGPTRMVSMYCRHGCKRIIASKSIAE
jgi:hypothetical protein